MKCSAKIKICFVAVLLGNLFFNQPKKALSLDLGQCHWVGGGAPVDWAYSGEPTYGWGYLEPVRSTNPDDWKWDGIDNDLEWAKNGKKIWLSIKNSAAGGYEVPQWAKADVEQFTASSTAACWDPEFLLYFEEALQVMAEKYDKLKYWGIIEAINIEGCGNHGEMGLKPKCCSDTVCKRADGSTIPPDVTDPNNPYVISLARAYGKPPLELTQRNCQCGPDAVRDKCFCFDYYFIKSVNRMIDLYMKYFKHIPAVLQLGTGLSCKAIVYREAMRYANCAYPNRVWAKFNGWGPFIPTQSGSPQYTRIGYEVGDQNNFSRTYWRNDSNKNNVRDCLEDSTEGCNHQCPASETPDACEEYGRSQIESLIERTITNKGVSYLCLQSAFYEHPQEYYLSDFSRLKTLLANAPTPGPIPESSCQALVRPDAGLNMLLSLWDPVGPLVNPSIVDFNQDRKINEADLTILLSHWGEE